MTATEFKSECHKASRLFLVAHLYMLAYLLTDVNASPNGPIKTVASC